MILQRQRNFRASDDELWAAIQSVADMDGLGLTNFRMAG